MPVARPPTEGRFGGRGERGLPARLGGVPAPLGGSLLGIFGPRRRPSLERSIAPTSGWAAHPGSCGRQILEIKAVRLSHVTDRIPPWQFGG
jgi:hypothetical protein